MRQPLQVAFVITELDVGGAERCLANIASGLDPARFAAQVYALRPPPDNELLVQQLRDAEVPVHFLDLVSRARFFKAVRQLRAKLAEQRPAIVQTFLFHANVVGALAASKSTPPFVLGGMRVADPSRCRMRAERHAARHMTRMVCVSQSVAEFAVRRLKLSPDKVVVIPNGIDLGRFPTDRADSDSNGGRLLFVGRLHQQKGLDWFFPQLPEVFREIPHARLQIVGDGPQRHALERAAAELQLSERIEFLGWRSDADRLISECSLLVLPSRWEGMPNVVMEAMAAGKPVLAARAEGVVELLGPGHSQQTVAHGDSTAVKQLLLKLLGDRSLRRTLGQQNRARVESDFSLQSVVSAYSELFESCVS